MFILNFSKLNLYFQVVLIYESTVRCCVLDIQASTSSINSRLWTPQRALSCLSQGHLPEKKNKTMCVYFRVFCNQNMKFFTSSSSVSLAIEFDKWLKQYNYNNISFLRNADLFITLANRMDFRYDLAMEDKLVCSVH